MALNEMKGAKNRQFRCCSRVSQCWKSQKAPPATGFSRSMYIAIYKKAIFFENFNGLRLPLRVSNICSAVCSYEYRASTEVTEIV